MGWPTIPPDLIASDFVTIQRAGSWTQDASGGKVRNLGPPSAPVPCSIKPGSATQGRIAAGRSSNFRDTMFSKYIITFANVNPQLNIDDQINWLNEGKTLIVVDEETAGTADARLWNAYVNELKA